MPLCDQEDAHRGMSYYLYTQRDGHVQVFYKGVTIFLFYETSQLNIVVSIALVMIN